jgi:hypothetical protein
MVNAPKQSDNIIYTKVMGVTFDGRQELIIRLLTERKLLFWRELFWARDVGNTYDPNAVSIYADPEFTLMLGHLRGSLTERFVHAIDAGLKPRIILKRVSGVDPFRYIKGLNIIVYLDGSLVK